MTRFSAIHAATFATALAVTAGAAHADWGATLDSTGVGNQIGGAYSWNCPGGGVLGSIWGSGLYTSDSSLCTAAVHSGHITQAAGGQITFTVLPGAQSYPGSSSNGVSTMEYGSWNSSFQITGAVRNAAPAAPAVQPIDWSTRPLDLGIASNNGMVASYSCPPAGALTGPLWGAGIYTSDSSICLAATHAGRLIPAQGGVVTVQITGAQDSYAGTSSNGVTSNSYGPWSESFVFQ